MRVPALRRAAVTSLFWMILAVLTLPASFAETGAEPPAENISHALNPPLPASLLHRIPSDVVRPQVLPPRKRIDPKHDVNLIGRREIGKGLDFYSLDREASMGRLISREVENSVRLVSDPVVTEYVNRLGQRLARNSDAQVPFTIKVIDNDEVNAFALPGGYLYVNTGLILAAGNEAGLAGVMAHEIAHVAARHATKNQTKSDIFNIVSIPLIFFGGPAVIAARQVMGFAVPMGMLKFNRNAEREADTLGLQYGYSAGYDPQEYVKLFERLKKSEEKKTFVAKMFSTHPMTGDRVKRAQKEIADYLPDREQYIVDTSEFQQVRARVVELSNRLKIDQGSFTPVLHRRGSRQEPKKEDGDRPTLNREN